MHCVCTGPRLSQNYLVDPEHSDRGTQNLSGCRLRAGDKRAAPQFRSKPDRRDLGDEIVVPTLSIFRSTPFRCGRSAGRRRSMKPASPIRLAILFAAATVIWLAARPAFAADIQVMISSGF